MIDKCILKNNLKTDPYDLESYVSYDNTLIFFSIEIPVSQISTKTSTEASNQENALNVYADINSK